MSVVGHLGGAVASVARAASITLIALLCVVAYTAGSLRRLAIRDRAARTCHRERQRGRLLRWSFAQLGATFVKIGQVASSRPDVFSPGVIDGLRSLQDRVPAFSYRRVRAVLARELGAPIEERFRSFDPVPLAAGGIAQVHRAELMDGTPVAVKVLRPRVRARAHRDGRLLLWLAHIAHAVSARARTGDAIGHARRLVTGLVAQTDLRREARNNERFRLAFRESRDVAFPRVYPEWSTRDVLVMELVHGTPLLEIAGEHSDHVTRSLREAFFAMCFERGMVHADLHPGNVLVRDDGVVVLLDLGLVTYLSPTTIDTVVDFTRCMVLGDAHDLVAHLRKYHRAPRDIRWTTVEADATAFIAELRRQSVAQLEVGSVVSRLFGLARKHHIRPMPQLSLVLLGMVTIEGIAKRLDPRANTAAEIARYLGPRLAAGGPRLARGSREFRRGANGQLLALSPRGVAQPPREHDRDRELVPGEESEDRAGRPEHRPR
ncbi:MAG: AarF/ABC1/UbiB kinase family protein [Myxococcales bacterium]|nr:AarF/ABC1/UbiB kinase family protein [Myxococcales bacterium]